MIHLINRVDFDNCGDFACCLGQYLKLPNYMNHDIDAINWQYVKEKDLVIFGGGGMLNCTDTFNTNIRRALRTCESVIGFGFGFNTHDGRDTQEPLTTEELGAFKYITVRDFNHPSGIRYTPCPSVLHISKAHRDAEPLRKVGVIHHKVFNCEDQWHHESIVNSRPLHEVLNFISTSEEIVTRSYHAAYWGLLMNKKVTVQDMWSEKFRYMNATYEGNILHPIENYYRKSLRLVQSGIHEITSFWAPAYLEDEDNTEERLASLELKCTNLKDQVNWLIEQRNWCVDNIETLKTGDTDANKL